MPVQRIHHAELMDLLDRILDNGLVLDAAERVGLSGIELLHSAARTVITSWETVG